MGIGILIVFLAPVLNIPILFGLAYLAKRALLWMGVSRGRASAAAIVCGLLLLVVLHVATYLPGRRHFDALCEQRGKPTYSERVVTDTIYFPTIAGYEAWNLLEPVTIRHEDGPTPSPFRAIESAHDGTVKGPFRFVLGPDGKSERLSITTAIPDGDPFTATYAVSREFVQFGGGTNGFVTVITERHSGRELARATTLHYDGGPGQLLRGVAGVVSCPSGDTGHADDDIYVAHYLVHVVLGGFPLQRRAVFPSSSRDLPNP